MTNTIQFVKHLLKKKNDSKKEMTAQTTKYIASLTDADVIVFVNITQLDAADQLRL